MRASFGLAFPSPAGVVWDRDDGRAKEGGLPFVVGSAELRVLWCQCATRVVAVEWASSLLMLA